MSEKEQDDFFTSRIRQTEKFIYTKEGGVRMTEKRTDTEGRELFCGEYERQDGRYEYRYKTREGKRCAVYAYRLSDLRHEEARIAYREYLDVSGTIRCITLNDQYEIWISGKQRIRTNTRALYHFLYDTYVRNSLGKKLIDEIDTFDIKCHYNSLIINQRVSVETVSKIQNVVYQVFCSARERNLIRENPAERACREFVRSRSKHTSNRPGLYKKQAMAFLEYIRRSDDHLKWYPLIHMFIFTGLRISEMAGLRWTDIDFDHRVITVDHSVIYCNRGYPKAEYHVFPPKTEAGYRKIPISKESCIALQMERDYQRKHDIKCEVTIDGLTDFVFLNRFGNIITQAIVNRALTRLVMCFNEENITDENGKMILLPKITTHSLRHTFANILCEDNVNIKVIQTLMGQSDIETTMNIYTKVNSDFQMQEYIEKVHGSDSLGHEIFNYR